MVHVVAHAVLKPGYLEKYLEIVKANLAKVRAEEGCLQYELCRGADDAADAPDVFILETWASREALQNHLASAHMAAFREAVKDMRASNTVTVLKQLA